MRIKTNRIAVGFMIIFRSIRLIDGKIGNGLIERTNAGQAVREGHHDPHTTLLRVKGIGSKHPVCHLDTVLHKRTAVRSQMAGSLCQSRVDSAGAVSAYRNRDHCVLVNTQLRLRIPAFGTSIQRAVAVRTAIAVSCAIGVDLTVFQSFSMGPNIRMQRKEFRQRVQLSVTVQPQTTGVSGQFYKLAVDITVYLLSLPGSDTRFCLCEQMPVLLVIGQKQIFSVAVGIVRTIDLRISVKLGIIESGYRIGVEVAVGIKHTGIDPSRSRTAGNGVVVCICTGRRFVLITCVAHHRDPVIYLMGASVICDQGNKVIYRQLQIIQVTALDDRTGLIQYQHDIQRCILPDVSSNGIVQGIVFQLDRICAVILQGCGFI